MILRRLGNKKKIAKTIQQHFPTHKIYIEPFFGAGGMFFNKPKAKYNVLNDRDSDVFNLFNVVVSEPDKLRDALSIMPISEDLWEYWKVNKETEPIRKAMRFILLSNYGYMGKPNTMKLLNGNTASNILKGIDEVNEMLFGSEFTNVDFRKMLKKIPMSKKSDRDNAFIYCDPPYLGTSDNYAHSFTYQDSEDLFKALIATGCKFAVSEFDNPQILDLAKKYGLEVIIIGERQNLKNRRVEILVINYSNPQLSLF